MWGAKWQKRLSNAHTAVKEWVADTEVARGRSYVENKHAISITARCRFGAECSAMTHAWHQSSPTWPPEEPSAMQKWGHIFQHQCPTVYRQAYTNTPTHPHKDIQRESSAHIHCTFFNYSAQNALIHSLARKERTAGERNAVWYHDRGRWLKRVSHDMQQGFPMMKIIMSSSVIMWHKRGFVQVQSSTYTFILSA